MSSLKRFLSLGFPLIYGFHLEHYKFILSDFAWTDSLTAMKWKHILQYTVFLINTMSTWQKYICNLNAQVIHFNYNSIIKTLNTYIIIVCHGMLWRTNVLIYKLLFTDLQWLVMCVYFLWTHKTHLRHLCLLYIT